MRSLRPLLLLTLLCLTPLTGAADTPPDDYRVPYRAALEAYERGDKAAYLTNLEAAAAALPLLGTSVQDDNNRPFLFYHLARAYAFAGDPARAVATLHRILDEDVEGLLVSHARVDPAFEATRQDKAWKGLQRRMDHAPVRAQHLAGSVHLLSGAGCAVVASVGPDGILLVDTGYEPAARGVAKALGRLSRKNVEVIINTHAHEDHVGGNSRLGPDARIIAHDTTRRDLAAPQPFIDFDLPPKPPEGLPDLTTSAPLTLTFNGEEIQILPLPGHTDGDLIVWFPQSHVLVMGDRYTPVAGHPTFPYPGEDLPSFLATMGPLVDQLPPEGVVVSGHHPPVPLEHLRMSYGALTQAAAFVQDALDDGLTQQQIQAAGLPSAWEAWGRGRPSQWLTYLVEQLSDPPPAAPAP